LVFESFDNGKSYAYEKCNANILFDPYFRHEFDKFGVFLSYQRDSIESERHIDKVPHESESIDETLFEDHLEELHSHIFVNFGTKYVVIVCALAHP
jgi:hypothetical protein